MGPRILVRRTEEIFNNYLRRQKRVAVVAPLQLGDLECVAIRGAYAFDGTTVAVDGTFAIDFTSVFAYPVPGSAKRLSLNASDNVTGEPVIVKSFRILDRNGVVLGEATDVPFVVAVIFHRVLMLPVNTASFSDMVPAGGTYQYRVAAYKISPATNEYSNIAELRVK